MVPHAEGHYAPFSDSHSEAEWIHTSSFFLLVPGAKDKTGLNQGRKIEATSLETNNDEAMQWSLGQRFEKHRQI